MNERSVNYFLYRACLNLTAAARRLKREVVADEGVGTDLCAAVYGFGGELPSAVRLSPTDPVHGKSSSDLVQMALVTLSLFRPDALVVVTEGYEFTAEADEPHPDLERGELRRRFAAGDGATVEAIIATGLNRYGYAVHVSTPYHYQGRRLRFGPNHLSQGVQFAEGAVSEAMAAAIGSAHPVAPLAAIQLYTEGWTMERADA